MPAAGRGMDVPVRIGYGRVRNLRSNGGMIGDLAFAVFRPSHRRMGSDNAISVPIRTYPYFTSVFRRASARSAATR